jgi:hypothetical protein
MCTLTMQPISPLVGEVKAYGGLSMLPSSYTVGLHEQRKPCPDARRRRRCETAAAFAVADRLRAEGDECLGNVLSPIAEKIPSSPDTVQLLFHLWMLVLKGINAIIVLKTLNIETQ